MTHTSCINAAQPAAAKSLLGSPPTLSISAPGTITGILPLIIIDRSAVRSGQAWSFACRRPHLRRQNRLRACKTAPVASILHIIIWWFKSSSRPRLDLHGEGECRLQRQGGCGLAVALCPQTPVYRRWGDGPIRLLLHAQWCGSVGCRRCRRTPVGARRGGCCGDRGDPCDGSSDRATELQLASRAA